MIISMEERKEKGKEKKRRGEERRGEERRGEERRGKERKGKERKGKERKGKEKEVFGKIQHAFLLKNPRSGNVGNIFQHYKVMYNKPMANIILNE